MENLLKEASKLILNKGFEIIVDNSNARTFNINIDNPMFFCFAQNENEAIGKMKQSDFAYKHKPIKQIFSY